MPFPLIISVAFWTVFIVILLAAIHDRKAHVSIIMLLCGCFYLLVKIVYLLDPHHFPLR